MYRYRYRTLYAAEYAPHVPVALWLSAEYLYDASISYVPVHGTPYQYLLYTMPRMLPYSLLSGKYTLCFCSAARQTMPRI